MRSSQRTIWTLCFLAIYGSRVLAKETCTRNAFTYTYCEDGYYCCDNNTKCCSVFSIGVIIGIVIGGILLLSCCGVCIVLAVKKNKKPGTVINPMGPGQHNVTVATVNAMSQYPGGSAQPYGQPYGQPFGQPQAQQFGMGQPPPYGEKNPGADPAYPPPPPAY